MRVPTYEPQVSPNLPDAGVRPNIEARTAPVRALEGVASGLGQIGQVLMREQQRRNERLNSLESLDLRNRFETEAQTLIDDSLSLQGSQVIGATQKHREVVMALARKYAEQATSDAVRDHFNEASGRVILASVNQIASHERQQTHAAMTQGIDNAITLGERAIGASPDDNTFQATLGGLYADIDKLGLPAETSTAYKVKAKAVFAEGQIISMGRRDPQAAMVRLEQYEQEQSLDPDKVAALRSHLEQEGKSQLFTLADASMRKMFVRKDGGFNYAGMSRWLVGLDAQGVPNYKSLGLDYSQANALQNTYDQEVSKVRSLVVEARAEERYARQAELYEKQVQKALEKEDQAAVIAKAEQTAWNDAFRGMSEKEWIAKHGPVLPTDSRTIILKYMNEVSSHDKEYVNMAANELVRAFGWNVTGTKKDVGDVQRYNIAMNEIKTQVAQGKIHGEDILTMARKMGEERQKFLQHVYDIGVKVSPWERMKVSGNNPMAKPGDLGARLLKGETAKPDKQAAGKDDTEGVGLPEGVKAVESKKVNGKAYVKGSDGAWYDAGN
ncbi:MAG: hypothetical protein ABFD81_09675 [Syntrophaceae bacterium]